MAEKTFGINTEPHVATIGDDIVLEFKPEVLGTEFLDAYDELRTAHKTLGLGERVSGEALADVDIERIRAGTAALRAFLGSLMLPESAELFAEMQLPDRVLVELMSWTTGLYGGRPTTQSKPSAEGSSKGGKPSTGSSRSKGSTRKAGPSHG